MRRHVVQLSAEIEHRGDARREKELWVPFLGRVDVHVHVDKAGNDELAPPVENRRALRDWHGVARPDADDPLSLDQDARIR
jgi:hypothetical protein